MVLFIIFVCAGSSLLCRLLSSCGVWASHCSGFSWCGAQVLGRLGFSLATHGLRSGNSLALERRLSSCAHGLSCSGACGIFSDQGSNPCLLYWQADSLPLSHEGSLHLNNSLLASPLCLLSTVESWSNLIQSQNYRKVPSNKVASIIKRSLSSGGRV